MIRSRLHHVCIAVNDFDWYFNLFTELFGMHIERTAKEPPKRQLWFEEGIQLKELPEGGDPGILVDHISIGVEDIPATVAAAIAAGCSALPNGEHWFELPNHVKVELKPY